MINDSVAQPGPRDHVLTLCHMLANRIGKTFYQELEKFGFTLAEWRVMLTLATHQKASSKDITSRWAMDKMAISRAVSNLENRQLIEKRNNNKDKRSYDMKLTKTGQAVCDKMLPLANKHYHKLVADLDKPTMLAFRSTLIGLITKVDELIE